MVQCQVGDELVGRGEELLDCHVGRAGVGCASGVEEIVGLFEVVVVVGHGFGGAGVDALFGGGERR